MSLVQKRDSIQGMSTTLPAGRARAFRRRPLLPTVVAACASLASVGGQETIRIHGSDTMGILNRELAAAYARKEPAVKVMVQSPGSERGITALIGGEADIAASSRPMKEPEKAKFEQKHGRAPQEIVVALDGLGVYVHDNNPVSQLTMDQVAKILAGEIRNWREVGGLNQPIHIYNRDVHSGTRTFVQEHVLGTRKFSPLAHDVSSTPLLMAAVARNQNAIGYGGVAYAQGAHIVKLAARAGEPGVWPGREEVAAGRYPLSRALYFYVNPITLAAEERAFLDWVLGPEGREVVTFVGYYPPPPPGQQAKPGAPTRLLPDNLKQHGFEFDVAVAGAGAARPDQVDVSITFAAGGQAIQRMKQLSVRIGDDAELPLTLDASRSLRFTLRRSMLGKTVVHLAEGEPARDGATYTLAIADFTAGR